MQIIYSDAFIFARMQSSAKSVAEKLLQAEAVKLSPGKPYTWASGWKSPIYCDNRRLLSYPFIRDYIKSELTSVVFEKFPDAEVIAGVATAGIAWGAMVADQLKLPYIYVRPKPKEHGMGNQVEGYYTSGQRVVVMEDLISTGNSSLAVCKVLTHEGMQVEGMVSIFNYGFEKAAQNFIEAGIKLYSLTNYPELIDLALEKQFIEPEQVNTLLNWRSNPAEWEG